MKKFVLVPALALAALTAGCGGSTSTSSGPASAASAPAGSTSAGAPASTAASPSASSPSASSSSASSPSAGASSSADSSDVCALLGTDKVNELTGGKYTTQTKQTDRCTYTVGSSQSEGLLTGIKQTTESLASLLASEKKALGGTSKSTRVNGAEEAGVVTAKDGSKNAVSVLAKKDDTIYLVIIENSQSASQLETSATKVTEALIKA